ncbi:Hypothetical protein, putative [Bodo saltans]|uniref:Uncharacterized protein n=1 Tax=Bodo saltans TaxID=75058 RepID=A0A0S4JQE8_BODSA|nr:Hypothetical protein, putative [Bodo saltans]|eukprot:CUG90740.1 Hypothetical protein, putative [Bodo saltans]
MFPIDKAGERHKDPSSPKIAVYSAHPTSKPTVTVSEVKPAPGSAMRSRIKLLQEQKKMPSGGWTSSSIHTPSSQEYLQGTLPPTGMPGTHVAPLGLRPQSANHLRSKEENLADQVQNLESQLEHYKSVLGTHHSNSNPQLGNNAGQYPATTLLPQSGHYPPQPLAYSSPPFPGSAIPQPRGAPPTAPGPHQATLGYPNGARHFPVTAEQPYVGAAANFSRLSSQPTKIPTKGAAPSAKPLGMPAVETHNTALLEHMQQQQRAADAEAVRLQNDLLNRDAHRSQIEQELLYLRKHAAESHALAQKSKLELDNLLARRAQEVSANEEVSLRSDNLKQRYDFVLSELDLVKKALDEERKIQKYQPLSATSAGFAYGNDPMNGALNDFSSTALACDNESLKAQVADLVDRIQQRDAYIDNLNRSNETLIQENTKLMNDMRHEEQKYHISLSTTESHKVLLGDAQSEVEYLRLMTAEQKDTIDRLTKDHEERFERIKTEMCAREVRELQARHATEGAKSLHMEAAKVHKALLAEQAVNETLRDEILSLQRQLEDERHKNRQSQERYEKLCSEMRNTDDSFTKQTATLEVLLNQWQQQQARQASEERGQLQHANDILRTLKALEMPSRSGKLEAPVASVLLGESKPIPVLSVPPALLLSPPHPPPVAPSVRSIGDEVSQLLRKEEQYRRDAEASRVEAMAALAMHNKALEAV